MNRDACVTCGTDTGPGTRLFSDRRRIHGADRDGVRFECAACARMGSSQERADRTVEKRELGLINSASVGIWND